MGPAILTSLGFAVYLFVKTMTDYILKKKMIEKGFIGEDAQAMFKNDNPDAPHSSLKWGLIILFAGVSLILMEFIQTGPESPLPYGLFAVAISLGFLVYYAVVRKGMTK